MTFNKEMHAFDRKLNIFKQAKWALLYKPNECMRGRFLLFTLDEILSINENIDFFWDTAFKVIDIFFPKTKLITWPIF